MSDEKGARKKRIEAGLKSWMESGSKGIFAGFGDPPPRGGGGGNDEPDKEDPLPPSPPPPPEDPASLRPASNNWPDIVKFYFPKGAGTQYKDGGLVRGGGAAQRGKGRGRIV